jgi:hypothetical protein
MNDGLLISPARSLEPAPRDRITALASAMQRRPIVIVLGAPGSGASLCAHILSALGVDMVGVESGSGTGPWERAELVALHDRILALFNRAHLGPFHDFGLPVAWWADPRVALIKREIVACVEAGMGAGFFGFKDPRAVRLLPVWQQVANELKLAPRLVFCLRNPAQIAALASVRDGLDPAMGEYRWLAHTIDFFRHANSFDICTVEYESWFGDPSTNTTKLKEFLGLEWEHSKNELNLLIWGIVGTTAQADETSRREPRQPLVRSLYKLARRADEERAARDQITSLAAQFVGFQQLQRPLQQAFEDVAKVVASFPELERELAILRMVIGERDALVETQRAQLADLAGEANGLRAALAEREAALAELSRKVDDLTASAQAERTAQQEAVQRAEQAAQQQAASAAALQSEAEALHEALARAEQEAEQSATVAHAMRGEIAALQETLAQTEHAGKEHAAAAEAAAAASEAEVEALRDRLARAQDEAAQRGAAAVALRDEIAELQGKLTAARKAGQAALAAFRIDMAAKAKPDGPRRWRRIIMRLLGASASF